MEKAPQFRRVPEAWGAPVATDGVTVGPVIAEPPLDVWGM